MFSAGVITTPLFSTTLFGTSILDNLADMTSHFEELALYLLCRGQIQCLALV